MTVRGLNYNNEYQLLGEIMISSPSLNAELFIELHDRIVSNHFFTQNLNMVKGECVHCESLNSLSSR